MPETNALCNFIDTHVFCSALNNGRLFERVVNISGILSCSQIRKVICKTCTHTCIVLHYFEEHIINVVWAPKGKPGLFLNYYKSLHLHQNDNFYFVNVLFYEFCFSFYFYIEYRYFTFKAF